jgi:hypothetical protein
MKRQHDSATLIVSSRVCRLQRSRFEIDTKDDKKSVPGVAAQGGRTHEQAIMHEDETAEEHEVEMEMNAILKKSPGTSFCSALPYAHR